MDPRDALSEGVVGVSHEITPELLFEAYSFGIFPWPHQESEPTLWFCPPRRGVLVFSDLHLPRSLIKYRRKSTWNFTLNQRFPEVMAACANAIRPEQKGTWITDQMIRAYLNFHQQGYAHSIECWSEGSLIGGMYGTYVAGVFSGESMFYREKNASKLCLLYLIEGLAQNGISWIDIQMLTPHLEALGAKTISRSSYLKWLDQAKAKASPLAFFGQKN